MVIDCFSCKLKQIMTNGSNPEEWRINGEAATEEEIALFAEDLGCSIPGKHDIELITKMLSQATSIDH